MGLFSKTPKPNPRILVEGLEIEYNREHDCWGFAFRKTTFCSFGRSLTLPTKSELDAVIHTLELLKPEIQSRLKSGLAKWSECSKLDDGESCLVDIKDLADHKTYRVSWSGGTSWGDLGVDFTIKDSAIFDEEWGD